MSWFAGLTGWRAYRKLPEAWRQIVFYSESGQDWHHFEPLISALNEDLGRSVTYITSDPSDPGLQRIHAQFKPIYLPESWWLILHFQFQKAAVLVLTMMDLDNLQLKRSINGVHYIYLFHSMGSTHMADHVNSYDAYDSLFCVGPHHQRELRRREELTGMAARELFQFGHPRLEQLIEASRQRPRVERADERTVVLVAPTWGEDSLFNRCGADLIRALLDADMHVIMRPHYHTRRLTPEVLNALIDEFSAHPQFEVIEQMGEMESLFRSDVLISDWSAMSIEYALALKKPVLSVDLPRRIRNPDWQAMDIEPFESFIRSQVGEIIDEQDISTAPQAINRLLEAEEDFAASMRALRETAVYNLGHCVPLGAREIARLADQRAAQQAAGNG